MTEHSAVDPHTDAAVITVSYGSAEALQVFLATLRKHHNDTVPVVVVDNKPDADNVKALASRFDAIYVPLPKNPGYGAAMNAGVEALNGSADAYFFCNPDVEFNQPVIHELSDTLASDPTFGAIAPKLLNEDGSVFPSARNIPSIGTGIGHALFSKVWRRNPWTSAYQNANQHDRSRFAGWLSGAAVMTRADVYREIRGWDENYFMHFEDIDLGFRIGNAGYVNLYDPSVAVTHTGAHSTKKHAVVVEKAMTTSAIRFMSKRYPGAGYAPLRWVITTGLRARGALRLISARRSAGQ